MKDQQNLVSSILNQFIQSHPELIAVSGNPFYASMIEHAKTYSVAAIEFTVKQMLEEMAMETKHDKMHP